MLDLIETDTSTSWSIVRLTKLTVLGLTVCEALTGLFLPSGVPQPVRVAVTV